MNIQRWESGFLMSEYGLIVSAAISAYHLAASVKVEIYRSLIIF